MLKNILIVGLAFASIGLAQRGGGGGGGAGGGQMGGGGMQTAALTRFDTIANTLNLDKDQKKTVRTILDDGAKEASPLRDQISKSRVAVGEAIAAQKGEDDLKQVARSSSDLSAQLTALEIKTFAKVFATLNDTQKQDQRAVARAFQLMNNIYHSKNWNE